MENSLASRFARLFAGRTDVAGVYDPASGETYTSREHVTLDTYIRHIEGKRSLGIAPLRDDGTVRFLAFDIDKDDVGIARTIRAALARYGLQGWIERTKSKGYHVWVFFADDTSAVSARKLARTLLLETQQPLSMEVFPKQDRLVQYAGEKKAIGNWINLPYFGALPDRRVFIEDSGAVILLPEFLRRVETGSLPEQFNAPAPIPVNEGRGSLSVGWGDRSGDYDGPTPTCVLAAMETDAVEGERHETGVRLVGYWRNFVGLSDEDTWEKLHEWNSQLAEPLSERRLRDCLARNTHYSWGCKRIREVTAFRDGCAGAACGLYNAATFGDDALPMAEADDDARVVGPVSERLHHASGTETQAPQPLLADDESIEDERVMVDLLAHDWLKQYIDFAKTTTDAPRIFHLISGLAVLGAAAGNRVAIPSFGAFPMFPSLYLVAIAGSGFLHKSTATGVALRLVMDAVPGVKMSDYTSPESFLTKLSERGDRILFIDEFGVALGEWNKRTYQSGMKGYLTTLFDNRPVDRFLRGEKGKGETEVIRDVALTMLSTTTQDWLQQEMKIEDLRAGFIARILWVWAEHKEPELTSRPFDTAERLRHLGEYLRQLESLPQTTADFSYVDSHYFAWLRQYEKQHEHAAMTHPEISGVVARAGAFVQKLAVILALSESIPANGTLYVRRHHLDRAIAFVEWSIKRQQWLVNNVLQFSEFDSARFSIINKLRANGGRVRYSDIVKSLRREKKKVDELLGTLVASGEVRKVKPLKTTPGRPVIFVCLPDRVLASEVDVA